MFPTVFREICSGNGVFNLVDRFYYGGFLMVRTTIPTIPHYLRVFIESPPTKDITYCAFNLKSVDIKQIMHESCLIELKNNAVCNPMKVMTTCSKTCSLSYHVGFVSACTVSCGVVYHVCILCDCVKRR